MPVSKDVFAHTRTRPVSECTVDREQKTTMPLVELESICKKKSQCHWRMFLFLQIDSLPTMATDDQQPYPLIKQSQVRKLRTYASSISSNSSSASSARTSPNNSKGKRPNHHAGDTDEGYASFTTSSTALVSQNSGTLARDDSAYYTSTSDHLPTLSSSSSSKAVVETDSEKSELSDEENGDDDDTFRDLVDWPSLNQQVQTLVSRLDKWLHHPLPDRSIPIEKPHVDHAYPILQRRTSSIPLSINLAGREPTELSHQTNYVVNFVQDSELGEPSASPNWKVPRPRVHFQLQNDQVVLVKTPLRRVVLLFSSHCNTVLTVRDWFNWHHRRAINARRRPVLTANKSTVIKSVKNPIGPFTNALVYYRTPTLAVVISYV